MNKLININKEIISTTNALKRYVMIRLQRNGVTEIRVDVLQYMCDEINEYIDDRFGVKKEEE